MRATVSGESLRANRAYVREDARRVSISLGADNGQRIEVRTGLTPDDQVIFKPGNSLADGAEVTPSPLP